MYLFQERKLSEVFSARNVVMESYVVKSKKRDLIFSLAVDFGVQGTLRRNVVIPIVDRRMTDVVKDIRNYTEVVLDIIDSLEETKRFFLKGGAPEQFHRVVAAESPLLFNSVRGNRFLRLEIYGKGLYDLSLQFEHREGGSIQSLVDRLDELASWMQKHLKSIDNLPLDAFAGAKA